MLSVADAFDDPDFLGAFFEGESWDCWRAIWRAAQGEGHLMTPRQRHLFAEVAQRDPPSKPVRELVVIGGRRGGKDSTSAGAIACAAASDYGQFTRPGETPQILCLAVDKTQARIVLNYTRALFNRVPMLAALKANETREGLELSNGNEIIVSTNNFRSVRGRTVPLAIFDEAGYWRDENFATPDVETYRAIRPCMATIPTAMLVIISTPYRRQGLLYEKYTKSFGKDDERVLVVLAPSLVLNPTLDQGLIDEAMADDAAAARAEYFCEWRDDIASFISSELIEAAVDVGVMVRPPLPGVKYVAGVDASSGTGRDSFGVAIAHKEAGGVVLDLAHEIRPPFNALTAITEAASIVGQYGIREVCGDRYAPGFVAESFAKHGIKYRYSERDRSAMYLECLPLFTSGKVRLVDNRRLVTQFAQLERRTSSSGKDRVDHPDRGHDDLSNAVAASIIEAHTHVAALAEMDDFLIEGGPALHPEAPRIVYAVLARGERGEHIGRGVAIIVAFEPAASSVVLVLVDAVLGLYGHDFLAEAYRRLQAWSDRLHPHNGFLAFAEPEVAAGYNAVVREIWAKEASEGRGRWACGCETLKQDLLSRGDLAAAAAGIVQSHRVKVGANLLDLSAKMPLGAALDMRMAGDLDDPLRRAVTLAIVAGGEDARF